MPVPHMLVSHQELLRRVALLVDPTVPQFRVLGATDTPLGQDIVVHLPAVGITLRHHWPPICWSCVAARRCPGRAFRATAERN